MNSGGVRLYYDIVAMICAVMTLVNVARYKTRGLSAYFLGGAFLVLGGAVILYSSQGTSPFVVGLGVVVALLLIADIIYRMGLPKDGSK